MLFLFRKRLFPRKTAHNRNGITQQDRNNKSATITSVLVINPLAQDTHSPAGTKQAWQALPSNGVIAETPLYQYVDTPQIPAGLPGERRVSDGAADLYSPVGGSADAFASYDIATMQPDMYGALGADTLTEPPVAGAVGVSLSSGSAPSLPDRAKGYLDVEPSP